MSRTARRPVGMIALIIGIVVLCCGGGASIALFGAGNYLYTALRQANNKTFTAGCGVGTTMLDPNSQLPRVNRYSQEQMRNAAIIVAVGQQLRMPPRSWVIAVATAIQESTLHNYGHLGARNDHDSLGLFQQRPSQGWGTPEEIQDPATSARKFYEALQRVPDWQHLALTDAAQRVQKSAYPDRYADDEPMAARIVNQLTGGGDRAIGDLATLRCLDDEAGITAGGWTSPLRGSVVSRFRTADRPTHDGADIAADSGTPIRAAAAGRVIKVRCNAVWPTSGPDWGCDRPGSSEVRGCGWYVDIQHPGGIITRYCHQVRQPAVTVGQLVQAGQVIGWVGSTGHSSGPHLHFEVHTGGSSESSTAVDPNSFMNRAGVPLGDHT